MKESLKEIRKRYEEFKGSGLSLNMERGWPSREQLDLSMPMLSLIDENTELCREVDYRGYAGTGGIEPLKQIFAEILDVKSDEIYIGGTMSTTIMYDIVNKAVLFGLDGHTPWKNVHNVKFLCPSPGYEKHFNICKTFGIEMIPVAMFDDGPDMDEVERLAAEDENVKGIWCVPLYSNPTGTIYSENTVIRLASLQAKAEDFRIFWDNAYCVHHLTDEKTVLKNIIRECEKYGFPNRAFEFTSTSKITFPGGGVGICASSVDNIKWLTEKSLLQLKSGDKINQLRHFLFLKDKAGVEEHMKHHRAIIAPKFDLVDRILHEELGEWNIASWNKPKGGYFISVKLKPGMARKVWSRCRQTGVTITPAGSTFPYGKDAEDAYLRIAPTYLSMGELEKAMRVLCIAVKLEYLLDNQQGKENGIED